MPHSTERLPCRTSCHLPPTSPPGTVAALETQAYYRANGSTALRVEKGIDARGRQRVPRVPMTSQHPRDRPRLESVPRFLLWQASRQPKTLLLGVLFGVVWMLC